MLLAAGQQHGQAERGTLPPDSHYHLLCLWALSKSWFHISFHTIYLQVVKGWTCPSTHTWAWIYAEGERGPALTHTSHAALPLAPAASQASSVVSSQAKEMGHAIHPGVGHHLLLVQPLCWVLQ